MKITIRVLNRDFQMDCAPQEQRRVEDLAKTLDARLAGFTGDAEGMRRLVLTSLALLDEVQATRAALARAHGEVERLNDMVAEARLETAEGAAPLAAFRIQGAA
ncbi:cell division protein ZapA [Terricaulis sp.]|uniref:cell division protein ZapA n=1 Tax=Terricaulis sp. TaxID=2768686 RepID=UPI003784ED16